MNFLRGVMGGQNPGPQPSGADTIQKLCDRVASSTLLDDRRDAVRALKSLSKKYRLEVGIQAMSHLIYVLQTDRSDSEIIGYALDTLCNIMSNDLEEEEQVPYRYQKHNKEIQNTSCLAQKKIHRNKQKILEVSLLKFSLNNMKMSLFC
ncbi:hypothetical protein E2320_002500 [Naja naja]|nr:hypothetical protein E2320_002500 [Naja naja]